MLGINAPHSTPDSTCNCDGCSQGLSSQKLEAPTRAKSPGKLTARGPLHSFSAVVTSLHPDFLLVPYSYDIISHCSGNDPVGNGEDATLLLQQSIRRTGASRMLRLFFFRKTDPLAPQSWLGFLDMTCCPAASVRFLAVLFHT